MTPERIKQALHRSNLRTLIQIAVRAKGLAELPIAVSKITLESGSIGSITIEWKSEAPDIISLDYEVKTPHDQAMFSGMYEFICDENSVVSYLRGNVAELGLDMDMVYAETMELLFRAVTAFVID